MRNLGKTLGIACLFVLIHGNLAAQELKLVRSLSGPSGTTRGSTFVFDETRNRFVFPQDKTLTVFFEWESKPGLHVLSGIWKQPDGRIASISPDVKVDAPGISLSCYWIFHLIPGMSNGIWTLDVRMDGQPAGSHAFEIAGMSDPRPEPAAPPPAPEPKIPATGDVYKAVNPSIVWIRKIDGTGRKFDVSSGFVFRKNLIATAFQCIDSATALEIEFADGRKVNQTGLIAWSRAGDWAIVAADTGALAPLVPGDPKAVAVGERLLAFNFEAGARIFGGVDIAGRQTYAGAGERIRISPPLAPQVAGGPLLNLAGEVVGVLGGALNQGGHHSGRMLNISPALWKSIQPENAAVPISALPPDPPAGGQTLAALAANGTLTAPLGEVPEFSYGGTTIELPKNPNDPMPPNVDEFSSHDRQITVYSFWQRRGKITKGEVGAKVYDPSNRLRFISPPKKVSLSNQPDRLSFSIPAASLQPGVYRVDVTWNGVAAWRSFIRVAE